MRPFQLLGTYNSLFTGKARTYLRFKKIPFEEVLSTGKIFEEIIIPKVGIPIIPVLIAEDEQVVQDTTVIIDYLEQRFPTPSIYPQSPLQKLVALLFEVYGDEWLVIPAMHYRWSIEKNRNHAIQEFGAITAPALSTEQQWDIGQQQSGRFSGMLPALGITDKTQAAIEQSYLQFLSDFNAHLTQQPFLLGSRPSIGDYGLIGPLYAHLYRDPASGEIMKTHAPLVADWVERMHEPTTQQGDFLPNDQIPDTLLPLLARMFSEHVPVLLSTSKHVKQWADENPQQQKIPRSIGFHDFSIEGVKEQRSINPGNQWMWQRPHDFYHALPPREKLQAQQMLSPFSGAIEALETPIEKRITRENNRFVLEIN